MAHHKIYDDADDAEASCVLLQAATRNQTTGTLASFYSSRFFFVFVCLFVCLFVCMFFFFFAAISDVSLLAG